MRTLDREVSEDTQIRSFGQLEQNTRKELPALRRPAGPREHAKYVLTKTTDSSPLNSAEQIN